MFYYHQVLLPVCGGHVLKTDVHILQWIGPVHNWGGVTFCLLRELCTMLQNQCLSHFQVFTWVKKHSWLRSLPHAVSQTHVSELIQAENQMYFSLTPILQVSNFFCNILQSSKKGFLLFFTVLWWLTLVWTLQTKISRKFWFLWFQPFQVGLWNKSWTDYSRNS